LGKGNFCHRRLDARHQSHKVGKGRASLLASGKGGGDDGNRLEVLQRLRNLDSLGMAERR
jgi:hypothetical protein